MLFAILFGLSMDYQVFLVSRMHEEWVHTKNNRRAITVGQAETGGIITAAAIIMIAVFLGFLLDARPTDQDLRPRTCVRGFLDAFILRTMLVPSLMHLFGNANWYFPSGSTESPRTYRSNLPTRSPTGSTAHRRWSARARPIIGMIVTLSWSPGAREPSSALTRPGAWWWRGRWCTDRRGPRR